MKRREIDIMKRRENLLNELLEWEEKEIDNMEKFTLYNLLNSNEVENFDLLEMLKIYVISSSSLLDRVTADVEEYFISEVPLYLLRKEVFKTYFHENVIEVFK